jgi:phenylalanyl-tRNA synthetase beta chain
MPTVTLSKKVVEKIVEKKLPIDKLKDRISMLGTDLESIDGDDIQVEIFPNRPDMLSEQGFARALASFLGTKPGLRKYKVKKGNYTVIVDKSVTMRPYTACAVVKGVSFDDARIREIMQMQEKLAKTHGRDRKKSAYGIYPLESISFPVNYIAKDPHTVSFRPLGFDKEVLASEVEKTHPKGQQYAHIAKEWKKYPFFIDSSDRILSILPYTNSHETGKVDTHTKDIFIESSGTDLQNVSLALNMFAAMFADMGGTIYSVNVQYTKKSITSPDLDPSGMPLNLTYVNTRLGLQLKEKEVQTLLARMGIGYEPKKKLALIPAYRADILHPVDLIEDIAIAYGYENFEEEIPQVATIGQEDPFAKWQHKIENILIGLGLEELATYNLTSKRKQTQDMNHNIDVIALTNSVSEEHHALRAWVLPSVMEVLGSNQHHAYPQNLFTIGTTFTRNKKMETSVSEDQHLSFALASEKSDYTQAKQIVDYLMRSLGVEYTIKESTHGSFIPGRCADVLVNKKIIGTIGEVHPSILERLKIDLPVSAAELNLSLLFSK